MTKEEDYNLYNFIEVLSLAQLPSVLGFIFLAVFYIIILFLEGIEVRFYFRFLLYLVLILEYFKN